jgi:hypothetical protein
LNTLWAFAHTTLLPKMPKEYGSQRTLKTRKMTENMEVQTIDSHQTTDFGWLPSTAIKLPDVLQKCAKTAKKMKIN